MASCPMMQARRLSELPEHALWLLFSSCYQQNTCSTGGFSPQDWAHNCFMPHGYVPSISNDRTQQDTHAKDPLVPTKVIAKCNFVYSSQWKEIDWGTLGVVSLEIPLNYWLHLCKVCEYKKAYHSIAQTWK